MTANQAALLKVAQKVAKQTAGIPLDLPDSSMTFAQREAYTSELAKIILQSPANYDPQTVANAQQHFATPNQAPGGNLTFAEGLGVFTGEILDQAQDLNPLSEQNRGTFGKGLLAIAAIAAAVAVFLYLPALLPTPKKARR